MKNFLKYSIVVFFLVAAKISSAQHFTLNGKATGIHSGFIFLHYENADGKPVSDSIAMNSNGKFLFSGAIAGPTMAYMSWGKVRSVDDPNSVNFFIDPAPMTITLVKDKFKDAAITGSKTETLYHQLEKQKKSLYAALNKISEEAKKETDKERIAAIRNKMVPYTRMLDSLDLKFFAAHPQSVVTAYMLQFHVGDFQWETLQAYYDKLGNETQQTKYGSKIKKEIEKLKAGSPGAIANDFAKQDINGVPVSLSEFKGKKFVIVDFWASWCVPCRKGNPHLKDIYAKYKDKGLEIIGVSDDDTKPENWKKAVAQDSLPWRHVLRGLDWDKIRRGEENENDISLKFGIHELPTKILVDKNGVIIGRYYEYDEELDAKLKEIFGE